MDQNTKPEPENMAASGSQCSALLGRVHVDETAERVRNLEKTVARLDLLCREMLITLTLPRNIEALEAGEGAAELLASAEQWRGRYNAIATLSAP